MVPYAPVYAVYIETLLLSHQRVKGQRQLKISTLPLQAHEIEKCNEASCSEKFYVSGTGTRGLEAARDFRQVHRVKQLQNPPENSS